MRAAWALTFALCLAACGPTTPTGGAAVRFADAGGAATTSAPLPNDDDDAWVLTIANNFRDCDPNAKTCSEQHTVASDGAWSIRKEPNPILADGKPVTSQKVMPARDLDALQEIVTSEAFEGEMGRGFACQGGKESHDYSWWITFKTAAGERGQQAAYCISGPADADNTPRRLLKLLGK